MSAIIKCRIMRETEMGVLIRQTIDGLGSREVWIPRSQCEHLSKGPMQPDGSRDATITMAGWLAEQHSLETE